MTQKFLLHKILNKSTKNEVLKEKSNRLCYLSFSDDFKDMIIKYEKGGTLKHFEKVEEIKKTSYGVLVTTEGKLWQFNNI